MVQRHQENIKQRELSIRTIGSKYGIKGYDHSPLEVEHIAEFYTRLSDIQKKQNQDTESLQSDGNSKIAEFQTKLQTLRLELGGLRMQKDTVRSQIVSIIFVIPISPSAFWLTFV
jgi:DNA repair protein RAD50